MFETMSDDFAFSASCDFVASFGMTAFILGLLAGLSHRIGIPELVFSLTNTGAAAAITFPDVEVIDGDLPSLLFIPLGEEVTVCGSEFALPVIEYGFELSTF